jgi:hypothetical protein
MMRGALRLGGSRRRWRAGDGCMKTLEHWLLDLVELALVTAGAIGFCLFAIAAMGG